MRDLLIKNGKVLIFQQEEKDTENAANNKISDIMIEKKDLLIKDGKIEKIEDKIEERENPYAYVVDARNHLIMPGFINTHAHIPMSIFRETTEGCSLYEWLNEKIWPREAKMTQDDIYWTSMLSLIEAISTGTTCINDHYFISDAIKKAVEQTKVRTVLTRVLMDTDGEEASNKRVQEFKKLYETRNKEDDLITYSVSPHSLYTCSDKCLQLASDLAKEYHLPVHIHFLESMDEIQDIQNKHGKTAIKILQQYFNDIHTILAHGVHLNDKDIAILKTMDLRNCT